MKKVNKSIILLIFLVTIIGISFASDLLDTDTEIDESIDEDDISRTYQSTSTIKSLISDEDNEPDEKINVGEENGSGKYDEPTEERTTTVAITGETDKNNSDKDIGTNMDISKDEKKNSHKDDHTHENINTVVIIGRDEENGTASDKDHNQDEDKTSVAIIYSNEDNASEHTTTKVAEVKSTFKDEKTQDDLAYTGSGQINGPNEKINLNKNNHTDENIPKVQINVTDETNAKNEINHKVSLVQTSTTIFLVEPKINWNGTNWAVACDFEGSDLSNVKTNVEICAITCEKTKECTHFTWTLFNNGTCWMKRGPVTKNNAKFTNDRKMICGLIDVRRDSENRVNSEFETSTIHWNGKNWAEACDFEGNDLSNEKTTSENCEKTCQKTNNCTHYSWTGYNGGTCWMKRGPVTIHDAKYNGNKGMICGVNLIVKYYKNDFGTTEKKPDDPKPSKKQKVLKFFKDAFKVSKKVYDWVKSAGTEKIIPKEQTH